jgi:hypothetical protein
LGVSANAQLVVNPNVTGQELVDLIVQDGIVVTNVLRTCPDGASASFDGNTSNIGIPTGALLSTGLAVNAIGPNNSTGAGGACFGAPGDPDVEGVAGGSTFDACILEFTIVPTCADLEMTFVFGSEEYPENINSEFKDAMVITISGPGFVGNENIALIPGTTTPVSVGTVNQSSNSGFYNNNNGGQTIQYDGFTTPITASVTVVPCQSYRIKIAVADGADCVFDSGVFIQENSMDCGVDIAIVTEYTAGDLMPIKGCRDYDIEFCRQGSTVDAYDMNVTFAGTAINGVDFEVLPDAVSFAPGEQCRTMTIVPIADGLFQGRRSCS